MITQKELKEILHYNPETGVFIWLKIKSKRFKPGDIAGSVDFYKYIKIKIKNKIYKAHRLAWLYMTGEWPKHQIDHINHIRDDNRWINLREATNQENHRNMPISKANKSGVCGVGWSKQASMWRAQIRSDNKQIHLGCFTDKFEAICARMSANNKYGYHKNHGET